MLASVVCLGAMLFAERLHYFRSPESILKRFFAANQPEVLQADTLILAGSKVEDLVIEKLRDQNASKRRYMMVYLGSIRSSKAVNVLQQITADTSEPLYMRADALQSLFLIGTYAAQETAAVYAQQNDELGAFAGGLLKGNIKISRRRSFWDAFWSRDVEHL